MRRELTMRERRRNVIAVLSQRDATPAAVAERPSPAADVEHPAENSIATEVPAVAAKPKRSTKRKTTQPDPPPPEGKLLKMRRAMYRPKVLLFFATAVVATAAIPQIAEKLPDPAARDEYRFETAKVAITPPPRDVPPDIVDQVLKRSRVPKTVSLLDDDLTEKLAKAFASHPWVAEVVSVRKSFPPRVDVQLKYRKPVAMVETTAGMYPVDEAAVLLPPEDFSIADTKRYPLLRGVQTKPHGPAGVRWGDVVVELGAKMAVALRPHWKELQLEAVVVPPRTRADGDPDSLKFVLKTTGGSRILWGRAPGSKHPGELSAEKKIGRLKKYLADFGGFDQPHGPYEIDIRHWQEITRRPLSTASRDLRQD
jgi:hypothetical protein